MDTRKAQETILRAVENPTLSIPIEELVDAMATVLVRNELLGAKPKTMTMTFLSQEAN